MYFSQQKEAVSAGILNSLILSDKEISDEMSF